MAHFDFYLRVTPDEWSEYYRGVARNVVATAHDGRRVQFHARHLQRFVSRDGIEGTFRLTIDADHNFVSLERLERGGSSGGWRA